MARADYSILRRPKMTALGENGTPEQKRLLGRDPPLVMSCRTR